MRPLIPLSMLALLPATLIACGGTVTTELAANDAGGGDANPFVQPTNDGGGSADADASPVVIDAGPPVGYPAPHPPMPQVITGGGAVMTTPHIIPIVFANDAFQTDINTFVAGIGATPFWTSNTQEYGVGAATGAAVVTISTAPQASIDDSAIGPWLAGLITAGTLPAATPNTLYAIYYPASTTITLQGATSCNQFGGYHNEGQDSKGNAFSYAVIPRCQGLGMLSGLDDVTGASSHEFIEAATDPLPQTTPAYGQVDDDHLIWEFLLGGGETGDMCAQNPGAFYKPQGFNYTVQRSWSNQQAAASHDPCAPALGMPYFNSAPVLNDVINLNIGGQSITTKGVKIPVGQSKVVELDLYSDAPTSGPWSVKAIDGAQLQQQGAANLTFTFDKTSGQNGDKIKMTIKVVSAGMYNVESFLVLSRLNGQESLWAGLVSN